MRAVIAVVVGLLCVVSALPKSGNFEQVEGYTFEEYVADFEKTYHDEADRAAHEATFLRNLADVISHNRDSTQTWKKGVNQFTDLNKEQMKRWFGGNIESTIARRKKMTERPLLNIPLSSLPDAVDWRTKNPSVITPVKNQGSCGSCWAFGATENMETYVALGAPGKLPILSPQNVVSCAKNPDHCGGTGGCGGATAEIAFDWAKGGIAAEKDYPYQGRDTTCKQDAPKTAKVDGYIRLAENNYTELVAGLANIGPMAVNVDANSWGSYSSGVFTACQFRDIDINHVVQAVGYGHDDARNKDYWIIRNSWGGSWGEKGYMRIERHSDGDMKKWCGPDTRPQDGTGCDGGPSVITVCGSCGMWYDSSYPTNARLL